MAASAVHAERRVALVIGNGAYAKVGKLPNPPRDARAIEAMLRGAGFDAVQVQQDLGRDAMRRALRDFSEQVRNADIAVVFYAGHGIEVNGSNYLIPVDAVLERDIDVEDEAVPLERVSQVLASAKRLRLIILDACRDNPFAPTMRRTLAGRSIGRGLAQVEVVSAETLIAFAAKAGSTAADGQGSNSPYTSALVKHLATPGLDVRLALGRVRDEVLRSTGSRQEPFVYGSLGGAEIAIVPGSGPTASAARPVSTSSSVAVDAVRVCREVEGMSSAAVLGAMAAKYRGTLVADCIAARLADLKQAATTRQAGAKAEADRICANVQSVANVAVLKAIAAEHRSNVTVDACISARIALLERRQTALAAPGAAVPPPTSGVSGEPH
ncbi:MAG TPA: caspase family protein, partial [Hyphomicrobiaceae bacterium]|nr:caspase family protein [Hyphomicrobiaceae bacterium]